MDLPTFENYTDTNGLNSLRFFDADGNVFWYSYKTLVAFKAVGGERVVRKNEWGPTTGKHLNAIDGGDKAARLDVEPFHRLYRQDFGQMTCCPYGGRNGIHLRDCPEA